MTCEHEIAFGGRTVAERRVGDIHLAEAIYDAGLRVPMHEHPEPYLGFVLEGTCREYAVGQTWDYEAPNLVVKTPGDRHWNESGRHGTRYLILEVGAHRELHGMFDASRVLRNGLIWARAMGLRSELRGADSASPLVIEGLVVEILADLAAERSASRVVGVPGWVRRARDLLHDRRAEPLRLAGLAAELGVHPSQLARGFRRAYGRTPGEYLRRCRLDDAVALLVKSDLPIPEVAARSGFCDQSHLTTALRTRVGVTPGRLRAGSR